MRAYIMTTGALFGLLTLAHIWRLFAEGLHLVRDRWFIAFTVIAAALCIWSWRLLWPSMVRKSSP